MAKVTYDNPSFEKGDKVAIPGIGEVENGKEFELTEDMKAAFERAEGYPLDLNDGNFKSTKKGGDD